MNNYMSIARGYLQQYLARRRMMRFYSQFVKKGELCFDIGANVGNRAKVFLALGARVVAVEPQETAIAYMRRQLKEKRLTLVQKGVSDRKGEMTLYINDQESTLSTFSNKWKQGRFADYKWNRHKQVPVTTLDCLIEEFGLPVLCKIDVEGHEKEVLKGLSRSVKYVSFEFTREFFDDARDCIDCLLALGYRDFNCALGESMDFLFPAWVTPQAVYEKLASIEDPLLWGDIYGRNLADRHSEEVRKEQLPVASM